MSDVKVIGDIILDKWVYGDVDRISPEAPVPVLLEKGKNFSLGGASNVASTLSQNGMNVNLYGVISKDQDGELLNYLIRDTNVRANFSYDHIMTTSKTRLVDSNGQHIARLDKEEKYTNDSCSESFLSDLSKDSVVVVSDYGKGVVKENTIAKTLIKTKRIFVDPKQEPELYRGAFLVKPNMSEYTKWFGEFDVDSAFGFANKYKWNWLLVTDGAGGMHLINSENKEGHRHYKEYADGVVDVTGAGDVALSAIVYAHCAEGINIPESVEIACIAATRSVEQRKVATIDFDIILDSVMGSLKL